MPITVNINNSLTLAGITFSNVTTKSFEGMILKDVNVPAAKPGALTARTDSDTGSLTLTEGHGITTGAKVDVYWSTGSRIGMTAGTVADNVVPVDGGDGDSLPVQSTTISVSKRTEESCVFDGDSVLMLVARADYRATFVLAESDGTELLSIRTGSESDDGKSHAWDAAASENTLAEKSVAKLFMSQGNIAAAVNMKLAVMSND